MVGSWQLAVGGWRLAVGSWRLAVGGWRLAVGNQKIRLYFKIAFRAAFMGMPMHFFSI